MIAPAWVLVPVTGRLPSRAFHSGQALFYLEIGTPKNSPDVCRRLTLSRNSANFHASLLDAPSRKQAFSPAPPDRLGAFFYRSSLFPKPLIAYRDSSRKKPCKQVACPNCASTVRAWRRRAFGDVPFLPTPNFFKTLNFLFTRYRPLDSKGMLGVVLLYFR